MGKGAARRTTRSGPATFFPLNPAPRPRKAGEEGDRTPASPTRFPRIVWTSAARKTTPRGTTHREARSDSAMTPRILMIALALVPTVAVAADPPPADIKDLKLREWEPRSMMATKTTIVETPKYPVIDMHNHLGGGKQRLTPEVVQKYLAEMTAAGVKTVVNLDGGWSNRLKETLAALDEAHPGRFLTFALVNFAGIDDPNWSEREARQLEESFNAGAKGLKFHKTFGLGYRYKDGKLMPVDDPKLDPIWEMCARHKRPVVIHIADPAAFFTPLDRFNERWHELKKNPGWTFYAQQCPN